MVQTHVPPHRDSEAGFTLMESLVSLALMLVVTGAAFSLINPNTATSQTQPEVMDMQQRARIGADMVSRDLIMAGAGVYSGPQTGALMNFFAPIIPRRMGRTGADAYTVVRSDAVTISYIPNTYSQTTIRQDMPHAVRRVEGVRHAQLPAGRRALRVLPGNDRPHLRRHGALRHVHDHPGSGLRRAHSTSAAGRPELQVPDRRGRDAGRLPHVLLRSP